VYYLLSYYISDNLIVNKILIEFKIDFVTVYVVILITEVKNVEKSVEMWKT